MSMDNDTSNNQLTHGLFALVSILLFIILFGIMNRSKCNEQPKNDFQCIILNSNFPEIISIVSKNEMIIDELVNIIKNGIDTWPGLKDSDKDYKQFSMILNKKIITENTLKCPNTYDLIKDVPGLINAGFLCVEPLTQILHNSYNKLGSGDNYRIHIPIIPTEKSNIRNDEITMNIYKSESHEKIQLNWTDLKTEFFVYNLLCCHQLFNDTDRYIIILALDVEIIRNQKF